MTVDGSILSRLRRGTVEALTLQAIGVAMLFLMHSVVGRSLGVNGYGSFTYALAVANILAVAAPLGFPEALLRFVSQYAEQEKWSLLRGVLKRAYELTFLSAVLIALLLWGISYSSFVPSDLTFSLRFAAILLVPLSFVQLRGKALRGLQRMVASIVPDQVVVPLLVTSAVLLFSLSHPSNVLLVYTAAAFAGFFLGSLWLWRSMPEPARSAKPEFKSRHWLTVSLPMMFVGLGHLVMDRIDVIMLGALSTVESVGLYGAASRIAYLNIFVITAINAICAPLLSSAFHGGRIDEFRAVQSRAMIWSAAGTLPLFVLTMVWPQWVLGFFGPEFIEGATLLRVLAVGYFFIALTGPVGVVLLMTGRERIFALTTLVMVIVNVMGNLVMIPAFGALGAAVVTSTSTVILYGWRFLISREVLRALP